MDNYAIDPEQPLPDLDASFRIKRGLLRYETILVKVFALTEKGCVIKTDEIFSPGDPIRLALSLTMPFDNAATPRLFGQVRECRKYCSNFFYFIDFTQENKRSAYADIARIRELLERKLALTHRRKGGAQNRAVPGSAIGAAILR